MLFWRNWLQKSITVTRVKKPEYTTFGLENRDAVLKKLTSEFFSSQATQQFFSSTGDHHCDFSFIRQHHLISNFDHFAACKIRHFILEGSATSRGDSMPSARSMGSTGELDTLQILLVYDPWTISSLLTMHYPTSVGKVVMYELWYGSPKFSLYLLKKAFILTKNHIIYKTRIRHVKYHLNGLKRIKRNWLLQCGRRCMKWQLLKTQTSLLHYWRKPFWGVWKSVDKTLMKKILPAAPNIVQPIIQNQPAIPVPRM